MMKQIKTMGSIQFNADKFSKLASEFKHESSQTQKIILLNHLMEMISQCYKLNPESCRQLSNFCHNSIDKGQTYYQCLNCTPVDTDDFKFAAVYCSQCFKKCRHQTHYFVENQASQGVYMFCSCGCSESVLRQSFCNLHDDSRVITVSINEHQEAIIQGLTNIISNTSTLAQKLQNEFEEGEMKETNNPYIQNLVDKLTKINKNSIAINRLSARWLSSYSSRIQQDTSSQLTCLELLAYHSDVRNLIRQVCKDKISKKIIIKIIDQIENKENGRSLLMHDYIIFDLITLDELAQQDNFYMGPKLHTYYESKAHFSLQTKDRCSSGWSQDKAMRLHGRQRLYWFLKQLSDFISELSPTCSEAQNVDTQSSSEKPYLIHQTQKICSRLMTCSEQDAKKCMNYISRFYKSLNEFEESYFTSELAEALLFLFLACYPSINETRRQMELSECQSSNSQQSSVPCQKQSESEEQQKNNKSDQEVNQDNEDKHKVQLDAEIKQEVEQAESGELCSWIHTMCTHSILDQSFDSLPQYIIEINKIMLRLLSIASAANFDLLYHNKYIENRIHRYSKTSESRQIFAKKFASFTHWMSLYSYSICFVDETQNKKQLLVFIIAALSYYENDKIIGVFIDRIWKAVFDRAQTRIYNAVDYSMHILRLVLRADLNLHSYRNILSMKYCTCMFENTATSNQFKSQTYLQQWFRQLLKDRRKISKPSLIELKEKGYLQFGKLSAANSPHEILRQWFYYNEEEQTFYLRENLPKPMGIAAYILDFPTPSDCFDYKVYYQCKASCFYQPELSKVGSTYLMGEVSKVLLPMFMKSTVVLQQLSLFWKISSDLIKKLQCNEQLDEFQQSLDEKTEMCGYLLLFALIQLNKLTIFIEITQNQHIEAWHLRLRQQLKNFKQHPQRFTQFAHKEGELQMIQKLFNVKGVQKLNLLNENNKDNKVLEKQMQEENKAKFQHKKQKINEKYKNSRDMMIKKLAQIPDYSQKQQVSEEICLICHEKGTQNNELIYLAQVKKYNTVSSVFLGAVNNASQTLIESCFHHVHLSCYLKILPPQNTEQQSQVDQISFKFVHLRCPLCSKPSNIIIQKGLTSKTERICQNLLNVSFVLNFKIYEPVNILFLYWSHLVESLGLNTIVLPNLNILKPQPLDEQSNLTKIDALIMRKLRQRIKQSSPFEISQFVNLLLKMETNIKDSKRRECQLVQSSIFYALLYTVRNLSEMSLLHKQLSAQGQCLNFLIKNIKMLGELLEDEQFNIVLNNVVKVTGLNQLSEMVKKDLTPVNIKLKVSLKFKLTTLPKCSKEALLMLATTKCTNCKRTIISRVEEQEELDSEEQKQKSNRLCLMCGEAICYECCGVEQGKTHWVSSHFGACFALQFSTLKIVHNINGLEQHRSVYYNSLMVAYADKSKYLSMKCDVFNLKEVKFQALAAQFIGYF